MISIKKLIRLFQILSLQISKFDVRFPKSQKDINKSQILSEK